MAKFPSEVFAIAAAAGIGIVAAVALAPPAGGNPPPPNQPPPPPTGTPAPPAGRAVGLYIPAYSDAMVTMVTALKASNNLPKLPIVAAINPASGPGDEYTGSTGPRSDIQLRINQLNALPSVTVIGYTGSWYAGALDNPPTGSGWPGPHNGVVYTMSQSQYNSIKQAGGKAIYLPTAIDKYAGVSVNGQVWYRGVKGLMIDEVYNGALASKHQFYFDMINYAKGRGMTYFKGNPGASVPSVYFTSNTFSNISVTEGAGFPSVTTLRGLNSNGTNARKCSFTRHSIPSISQQMITSVCPEVGIFFATDDSGSNQYDNPPTYFNAMCNWVDQYNKSIGAYT